MNILFSESVHLFNHGRHYNWEWPICRFTNLVVVCLGVWRRGLWEKREWKRDLPKFEDNEKRMITYNIFLILRDYNNVEKIWRIYQRPPKSSFNTFFEFSILEILYYEGKINYPIQDEGLPFLLFPFPPFFYPKSSPPKCWYPFYNCSYSKAKQEQARSKEAKQSDAKSIEEVFRPGLAATLQSAALASVQKYNIMKGYLDRLYVVQSY